MNSPKSEDIYSTVANIYAPTQDHCQNQIGCLSNLCKKIDEIGNENLIIGGDFNMTLNAELDKDPSSSELNKYRESLHEVIDQYDLVDIWRLFNPEKRRYTWRSVNPLRQSRIDFFLVSAHITYNITECDIKTSFRSDHSMITLNFSCAPNGPRGPGFYKFNLTIVYWLIVHLPIILMTGSLS